MKKQFGKRKTSPFRDGDLIEYLSQDGKKKYRQELITLDQLKNQVGAAGVETYSIKGNCASSTDVNKNYFLVYPNILGYPPDTGYPTPDPTLDDLKAAIVINRENTNQWAFTCSADCNYSNELENAICRINSLMQDLSTRQNLRDAEYNQHKAVIENLINDAQNANANNPAWLTEQINVSAHQKELAAFIAWKAESQVRYQDEFATLTELKNIYQNILTITDDICNNLP